MKDSFKPRNYKCSCGTIQTHYSWTSSVHKTKHVCTNTQCGKKIGPESLYLPKPSEVPGIRTPTKNRV
jgi:hypothetical protein